MCNSPCNVDNRSNNERKGEAGTPVQETYLYKAVATGQTLKSAEFKWYKINNAGQEAEYINILLESVRVTSRRK